MKLSIAPRPLLLAGWLSLMGSSPLGAAPVVPGLHGSHPLNEAERGLLLIGELRCGACHEGMGSAPSAPNLEVTGRRLHSDFIREFILDPAAHDAGTLMPRLLGTLPEGERQDQVRALAAYVASLGGPSVEAPPLGDPAEGNKLYHEAGCVACHSPREGSGGLAPQGGDVGLGHLASKYSRAALTDFLRQPLLARPAGRMPDLRLNSDEASAVAAYLLGGGTGGDAKPHPADDPVLVARGRLAFHALRCASCHNVTEAAGSPGPPAPAPPKERLRLDQGCLSETPGRAPDYGFEAGQREAIRSYLDQPPRALTSADEVRLQLTRLNCIACHSRDDYGGIAPDRDSFFHSTQEALGDTSRVPPPLTLVGAKLKPQWLGKVLYDGERVRPYMKTRMPLYGEEALAGLPEALADADHLPPVEFAELERESGPMMRDAAHLLLGDKGLNCIACHNFNGKDSPGMQGIDLMTSYQRLEPAWFSAFLRDPAKFRPGIIMPTFWPQGQAVQTEILGGDGDEQLRALWHYLSLGRSARDPSGLRVQNPQLVVSDRPLIYRGRSRVAGFRGIAIGHPGGWNFAFNAQNGALSALWKGEFVNVAWHGQGAGDFSPIGRVVSLAPDVAFLTEPVDPWPLAPVRTKEDPVNPDPLYPRRFGYAFEGYSIGEKGVAALRYRTGDVSITDRAFPHPVAGLQMLRRVLTFDAPKATVRYFRVLTGQIEEGPGRSFSNGEVRITIVESPAGTSTEVRPAAPDGTGRELIVRLPLPPGISTLTIDHELLR